jgi:hypothetical protein
MDYEGKYPCFDFSRVSTYPLAERSNQLTQDGLVWPDAVADGSPGFDSPALRATAEEMTRCRRDGLPIIWMVGAHPLKLGFSPLIIDLIARGFASLFATNGAGMIHDFELALIGETSEDVPDALPRGRFGMAQETGECLNRAVAEAATLKIGLGEAVGRFILGEEPFGDVEFPFRHESILAAAYECGIPATVHVGIGTDITDQHPGFDGAAKGAGSARDFGVYVAEVSSLTRGGVVLNIGSAVTGPEVLLKAVAMSANVGLAPKGLITANFDLRPENPDHASDPGLPGYYQRDVKSVVTRIPAAFDGQGYYIEANFRDSIPALYHLLAKSN